MHGNLSSGRKAAIKRDGTPAVGKSKDGRSATSDENWFSEAAWQLYERKPGTALYLTTELGDERLCQRYAAGDVRPPAYFLRALLRSDHGEQWLNAVMSGSDAEWWTDLRRERSIGAAAISAMKGNADALRESLD